jgi:hypothetical protein
MLSGLLSLTVVTLVFVGIRLLALQTIQQRRERQNRQINERLRTLIAAHKTLGGSFAGDLAVDPTHMRDLHVPHDDDTAANPDAPGEPSVSTGARCRRQRWRGWCWSLRRSTARNSRRRRRGAPLTPGRRGPAGIYMRPSMNRTRTITNKTPTMPVGP